MGWETKLLKLMNRIQRNSRRLVKKNRSRVLARSKKCVLRTVKTHRVAKVVQPAPVPAPVIQVEAPQKSILFPQTPREYTEPLDSVTLYMREVGQVELLTAKEEVELAARIQKGDDVARERMIRANLRLVVKIAREYDGYGMPLLDLVNEGNIGLMRAVEKFDPAKGGKLSTYSSWWIKQSIRRAIANQAKTVRLPIHMLDKMAKVRRVVAKIAEETGQEPTNEEVADELGISVRRINRIRSTNVHTSSMDAPIGDDDSNRMGDLIADDRAVDPSEQLDQQNMLSLLEELVDRLPERELNILRLRFGLDGGGERSLEDIGREFSVTRERIRQLQNLALAKLRKMIENRDVARIAA